MKLSRHEFDGSDMHCFCETDHGFDPNYTKEQMQKFEEGKKVDHICRFTLLTYNSTYSEYHCCRCNARMIIYQ